MMSPRSSGRYGNSFSYHAPRPPKMNLFTSKWSPISKVPSIDAEGILNACTINVVPKSARITVTNNDSIYSEKVASLPRRSLLLAASRGLAKTLVMRTCGRSQIAGYRLPPKLTQTASNATSLWRPPSPHPNRSQPLRPRTHRPAKPASPALRFFLRRARGEDVRPNVAVEQPTRAIGRSPAAPGSWRVVLRSILETSPPDTRWPIDPTRHRPKTPTVRCSRAVEHRRHLQTAIPE